MSNRSATFSMALGAAALLSVAVLGAYAQSSLSKDQQKCLNAINKDGAAVAKTQGKEHLGCVKAAGKGKLGGTAQACVAADAKGKVAKAQSKTNADAAKSCGTPPGFGFTGAAIVNAGARQADVDLVADLYGPDLDAALVQCAASKAGCACQQKVSNAVEKLFALKLAVFVGCKKAALKAGAASAAALAACVGDADTATSIAADTKGKIAKSVAGLTSVIVKSCDGPNVTAGAFPGRCSGAAGSDLGTCLDHRVECRVCTAIDAMDGLAVNCDLFDDGVANASCAAGAGPSPTATATFTPAPSPTFTPAPGETSTPVPSATATTGGGGTVLKGSLTATAGRFNYNLAIGLPAANAACNSTFAGTHACTYQELQTAAAAGDLVGLKDTGNNTVTAFWAIDNTAAALQQCEDDTPGTGSGLNWEYPTAHTASRGEKVPLTNATGALGALQTSLQCNFSTAWVGCCQ